MLKSTYSDNYIEAGCDEAGRGCLAGPVVAAAVILPKDYQNPILNDSKKLSEKLRNELKTQIMEEAIDYAIGVVSNEEIDEINILNASFLAMHRALDGLKTKPELLLIDGNRFKPYNDIPHQCIVKGDGKFMSIAAASILAKTYRDELMVELAKEFPQYGWEKNKAYATKMHIIAMQKFGQTKYHRKSFHLKNQLKLDL
jgi:ribonuclease HII